MQNHTGENIKDTPTEDFEAEAEKAFTYDGN